MHTTHAGPCISHSTRHTAYSRRTTLVVCACCWAKALPGHCGQAMWEGSPSSPEPNGRLSSHSCVYVPLCRSLIIKASKSNWITCASPKTKTNSTVLLNLVQKILHVHQQYTLYYITYNTKYTVCTSTVYIIVWWLTHCCSYSLQNVIQTYSVLLAVFTAITTQLLKYRLRAL